MLTVGYILQIICTEISFCRNINNMLNDFTTSHDISYYFRCEVNSIVKFLNTVEIRDGALGISDFFIS